MNCEPDLHSFIPSSQFTQSLSFLLCWLHLASNSSIAMSSTAACTSTLANAQLPDGYCAFEHPVTVLELRALRIFNRREILALERATSSVVLLQDTNNDDLIDTKTTLVTYGWEEGGLTHSLELQPIPTVPSFPWNITTATSSLVPQSQQYYLYASTSNSVYQWTLNVTHANNSSNYTGPGTWQVLNELQPIQIITNINVDSSGNTPTGHVTRTLLMNDQGILTVTVGSASNVDADSFRSRIRQFNLSSTFPWLHTTASTTLSFPMDYTTGTVLADGVRNTVGLAYDAHGVLWGVDNGPDKLTRDDLGGSLVTEDNPGEELNRFATPAKYGYPYCWTEYALPSGYGEGRGTVYAWPSFLESGSMTDEQCRQDYVPPELIMQGHSAPLGIVFYRYGANVSSSLGTYSSSTTSLADRTCPSGAFPASMDGHAIITFHGSWNRVIPTGYKVVTVAMDANGRVANDTQPVDLLAHNNESGTAQWPDSFRPVDVAFDECDRLWVTSDGRDGVGSKLVHIEYHGTKTPSNPSSPSSNASALGTSLLQFGFGMAAASNDSISNTTNSSIEASNTTLTPSLSPNSQMNTSTASPFGTALDNTTTTTTSSNNTSATVTAKSTNATTTTTLASSSSTNSPSSSPTPADTAAFVNRCRDLDPSRCPSDTSSTSGTRSGASPVSPTNTSGWFFLVWILLWCMHHATGSGRRRSHGKA
jgi:glucose/arabinose dehydrogenase